MIYIKPKEKLLIFTDNFIQNKNWHTQTLRSLSREKENVLVPLTLLHTTIQNEEKKLQKGLNLGGKDVLGKKKKKLWHSWLN